jgi:hypothetical protein
MVRSRALKVLFVLLAATAAMGVILAASRQEAAEEATPTPPSSATLGLTGEAHRYLQATGSAFPAADAGFSAYYRVPQGDGFYLDKHVVDDALFDGSPPPFSRMAETGRLVVRGGNFTVGSLSLRNIDGSPHVSEGDLFSAVNVYYDNEGWVVAYLPRDSESSRVWQAADLDAENPYLDDVSNTTLLNAVNEVLDGAGKGPIGPQDLSYYHWQHPEATNFLMFAVALEGVGSKFVSFDVPASFSVVEASMAQWSTEAIGGSPCNALTLLDDSQVFTSCGQEFLHDFVELTSSTHVIELRVDGTSEGGAAGSLAMIIYSMP